jgi:hypothetical protein
VFSSFLLGGFEGSTGFNRHGQWIDSVCATYHDRYLSEDYALLAARGIRAVRESVRWPLVDTPEGMDLSHVDRLIDAGRRCGLTTIYDLFHFGYPAGLDPFAPEFAGRFADYCYTVARRVAASAESTSYFAPVNEPSYFAWAAGEAGLFAPHRRGCGPDLKVALVQAAIQGTEAIWAACPGARIISVDPFCHVIPSRDPGTIQRAKHFNTAVVFESWDMISGRTLPELGGSPKHLDIVGINYYWNNQWLLDDPDYVLADNDYRRLPLRDIVRTVYERYGREMILTETSHAGSRRAQWLMELVREVHAVHSLRIPLLAACWYPVLEMPEWHIPGQWTRMGLWDLDHANGLTRLPHEPVLDVLDRVRARLDTLCSRGEQPACMSS